MSFRFTGFNSHQPSDSLGNPDPLLGKLGTQTKCELWIVTCSVKMMGCFSKRSGCASTVNDLAQCHFPFYVRTGSTETRTKWVLFKAPEVCPFLTAAISCYINGIEASLSSILPLSLQKVRGLAQSHITCAFISSGFKSRPDHALATHCQEVARALVLKLDST